MENIKNIILFWTTRRSKGTCISRSNLLASH